MTPLRGTAWRVVWALAAALALSGTAVACGQAPEVAAESSAGSGAPAASAGESSGSAGAQDGAESEEGVSADETAGAEKAANAEPERLKAVVLAEYPHDPRAYTQGLLWHEGHLYESAGQYGVSSLRRVELETGRVLQRSELPKELFAEGLALVGEDLYQLTWQAELGLMWNRGTFERSGQFYYEGEGWGLCYDGTYLYMSSGGPFLSVREPSTFQELRRIRVTASGRPVFRLNELECVRDEIYANVYGTDSLVRIRAATGEVSGWIDASGLLTPDERRRAEVLNGIAYLPERGTFLLTGKYWPKTFEVRFEPQETP